MNLTLQSVALGMIVGTVCILMLVVAIVPSFGGQIDPALFGTVTTAFSGMVGIAVGYFGKGKEADAVIKKQRAEILTLKAGKE